jgi:DNA-binding response OmpR family regulator
MTAATAKPPKQKTRPRGENILPQRMKVLYITTLHRTGGWLAEAFAADSAAQILLEEVIGVTAGLAKLRDEVFDAILISHEPGVLDALDLVEGLRAGGTEDPILLLGSQTPQEIDALCYEVGADDYCCVNETTVRGLLWKFARAIERKQLLRENRRLVHAERQRLKQEHLEAQRLLDQQRLLIADLEVLEEGHPSSESNGSDCVEDCLAKAASEGTAAPLDLPEVLVSHYRELLRTYVIMGVGNLTHEMAALSELLAVSNVSAQRALQLHVAVLSELVQGLGARSARHVMNRADLLVLEVLGHLADGYRQRWLERKDPPQQLFLPGFSPDDFPRLVEAA